MGPLFKRADVHQFAAYLSKSSSSSTSSYYRCMSRRSLAEGRAAGRSPFGAVRGYAEVASSEKSSLSAQTQKMLLQREREISAMQISEEDRKNMLQREPEISAMRLELEKIRNDFEKRNKESSERMQFQIEKLRDEIEEKIKKPLLEEELSSEIDNVKLDLVEEHTEKAIGSINVVDEKITGSMRLMEEKLNEVRQDVSRGTSKLMLNTLGLIGAILICVRLYGV